MFELTVPGILLLLLALFFAVLFEVGLFWCAASLVDAPSLDLLKTLAVSLVALIVWAGISGAVAAGVGRVAPLSAENLTLLSLVACLVLYVSWFFPAMIYSVAVPVSFPRGMLLSILQVLLRVFLYVLITAVVMVVLAIIQLATGPAPGTRTGLLSPLTPLIPVLV